MEGPTLSTDLLSHEDVRTAAQEFISQHEGVYSPNGFLHVDQLVSTLGGKVTQGNYSDEFLHIHDQEDFTVNVVQGDTNRRQRYMTTFAVAYFLLNYVRPGLTKYVSFYHPAPDAVRANIFAAELLMPERQFVETFTKLRKTATVDQAVLSLSVAWQVSPSAVSYRAQVLGLLP